MINKLIPKNMWYFWGTRDYKIYSSKVDKNKLDEIMLCKRWNKKDLIKLKVNGFLVKSFNVRFSKTDKPNIITEVYFLKGNKKRALNKMKENSLREFKEYIKKEKGINL